MQLLILITFIRQLDSRQTYFARKLKLLFWIFLNVEKNLAIFRDSDENKTAQITKK